MSTTRNPFKQLQGFRQANSVTGKTITVLIVVMVIVALAIGIMAAVIGRRYSGDPTCQCISVNDAGFRGFSIAMLVVGIPLLVIGFIFFGCTTEVAAAWNPDMSA